MKLPNNSERDPVFVNARREAVVIILLFSTFCVWSVAACVTQGYLTRGKTLESVETTWGMPTWVFWGIFIPWIVVDGVALWFCFFFMKNDDLGAAYEDEDLHQQRETLDGEASDE